MHETVSILSLMSLIVLEWAAALGRSAELKLRSERSAVLPACQQTCARLSNSRYDRARSLSAQPPRPNQLNTYSPSLFAHRDMRAKDLNATT